MPVVTDNLGSLEVRQPGAAPKTAPPSPPPGGGGGGSGGGGRRSNGGSDSFPVSKERLLMWLVLTGITMLFAGIASAYIISSGTPIWVNVALPRLLWANTFVLLASSATIERTRRHIERGQEQPARVWIGVTGVLGIAFLVGQLVAWRELVAAGVFLPTTLHSSFFYILTGLHGLHLLGGMTALGYVWAQIVRNRYTARRHEAVSLTAMYWHFMDGLWVFVFLLLILV